MQLDVGEKHQSDRLLEGLPFYKLAVPAVVALSVIFLRIRAGSSYLLLDKLLRLIFGKITIYDDELRKQVEETHDLEQMRIRIGLPVTNMPALKRLLEWAKSNGVGLHELRGIRTYVRLDKPEIVVRPSQVELWAGGTIVMALIILSSVLANLAALPVALTTSKATGHVYLMAQDHAERFSLFSTQFTAASCASGVAKSESDKELCSFLNDERYKEFIGSTIHEQRKISLFLLAILLPAGWLFGGLFFEIRRTNSLLRRLGKTSNLENAVSPDQAFS